METNLGLARYLYLIPLLPLLAAGITALLKRQKRRLSAALVIGSMAVVFLLSVAMFLQVWRNGGGDGAGEPYRKVLSFNWFVSGNQGVQLGFLLDGLSALMLIVVSSVSLLVFIFSAGYMAEDENFTRFFTFLSLFAGSMLGLVLANSLLLLFMFWELVGLSSYLLIGFWFFKPSAAAAAKKAFIVTRIGDIGFFLGLILLYRLTGTSAFYNQLGLGALQESGLQSIRAAGLLWGLPLTTLTALLIFCGAMGKSGQFPLHVWLPDAMEGPTPVSALIHAATMVAAGVFLVARMYPVFHLSETALQTVACIGGITALMAAFIGCAQFDIKRILAYSTVSQLGYMMIGLGTAGVPTGMFHLFTHAFFKALLFLGSGSIIHACHHEQDIRKMGGLFKVMPWTAGTYLLATGALCGIFPLAGFWSKDEILAGALHHAHHESGGFWYTWHYFPFICGLTAAFLTAFYMTRQCIYVFFGRTRDSHLHPHESPWVMVGPLVALAVPTVLAGFWALVQGPRSLQSLLVGASEPEKMNWLLAGLSVGIALAGILTAWLVYGWKPRVRETGAEPLEAWPYVFR
ncbi:MAG: NADH-quinone oxidoreductase subunit L, partial [Verrucomicrobiae bacterium]|nr:NADH-quinone oxidoreductase subunit L [Verrucomicrobiae bacterium]